MDDIERLTAQLDRDQPRWYIEWATGEELRAYVQETEYRPEMASTKLRSAVSRRLFHRILNAALGAGILQEAK